MKITRAFGNNILIRPMIKTQIAVSDSPSLCEYGEVMAVGDEVKKIVVGDKISFTVWGLNSVDFEGTRYYLVPEDPKFILSYID